MFLGEYHHTLDDRGRVSLPKKMRAMLEGSRVILTRGFEPCLLGYRRDDWEKDATKEMQASAITDPSGRAMRRYLFSGAEEVDVDRVGRILLSELLQSYAGISGAVVIIGAGDHFEIWDEQSWKTYLTNLKYPRA